MVVCDTDKLTLTVEQAGKLLGISRATAYMLANNGGIPVIRLGERRIVVPRRALERMLESAEKPKAGNVA